MAPIGFTQHPTLPSTTTNDRQMVMVDAAEIEWTTILVPVLILLWMVATVGLLIKGRHIHHVDHEAFEMDHHEEEVEEGAPNEDHEQDTEEVEENEEDEKDEEDENEEAPQPPYSWPVIFRCSKRSIFLSPYQKCAKHGSNMARKRS